jgi:CHAD domain-containing protein/CYTH domain-containing protein
MIPYKKLRLEQYYVSTPASPYTRYRKKGDTYYQTIKSGEGMVREEKEFEVSGEEYEAHKREALGRIITKDRYTFEYQGNTYEMDSFKGTLKGLCYLEIEFSDEESAETYKVPDIFEELLVTEVTDDNTFNNAALSSSNIFPTPQLRHAYIDEDQGIYEITPFLATHHAIDTMIYLLTNEIKEYQTQLQNDPKDVEALHQFRIHIRKLRALLQEFEPFFYPKWLRKHKKLLARLMEKTNEKRDNDVALTDSNLFQEQLSTKSKKILEIWRSSLSEKEKKLEKKLILLMRGTSLSTELTALNRHRSIYEIYQESAKQPLILVAITVIDQRIQEIISRGKDLKKDSKKKAYHKLRIQFKRLRYLFELLAPIIPQEKLDNALNHLKKIQTILGEINDLQVQKKELRSFCKSCKDKKQKSLKILQKKMKKKEKKKLGSFKKAFDTFKKEKSLYQKLLFL